MKGKPRKPISPENYVQNVYLARALKTKRRVVLYLSNRAKLSGQIQRFDQYSILFFTGNRQVLIFKHALISIKPVKATGQEGIFRLGKQAEK